MLTKFYSVIPVTTVVALLNLDIAGWLQGDEALSFVANWLASLWTALAALLINGLLGTATGTGL